MGVVEDVLLVIGLLAILVGAVLLSLPMGLIVGGVEAVVVSVALSCRPQGSDQ